MFILTHQAWNTHFFTLNFLHFLPQRQTFQGKQVLKAQFVFFRVKGHSVHGVSKRKVFPLYISKRECGKNKSIQPLKHKALGKEKTSNHRTASWQT